MANKEFIEKLKKEFNGCLLFEGREKGQLSDLEGKEVTIADYSPLSDYHAVIFEEDKQHTYLSSGGLKKLLSDFGDNGDCIGVTIRVGKMVKTANKRDYRPIEIVG